MPAVYQGEYRGYTVYYNAETGIYSSVQIVGEFTTLAALYAAIDADIAGVPVTPPPALFTCPYCGATFSSLDLYITHLMEVHPAERAEAYRPDYEATTYREIAIWYSPSTNVYYFNYQEKPFTNFRTLTSAMAFIDLLLAPAPTVPEEIPPVVPPAPTPISLPWYLSWIQDALNWWGSLWQGFLNWGASLGKAVGDFSAQVARGADTIVSRLESGATDLGTAITDLPGAVIGALIGRLGELFKRGAEESINQALAATSEATGASPEWKRELDATMRPFAESQLKNVQDILKPETYQKSPLTPEEAATQLTIMGAGVAAANIGIWLAHLATEAATLGQLEAVGQFASIVIDSTGINALSARMTMIPIEQLILKRAEQHYASLYTPEIPSYADLINQVVKEVIPVDEFKKQMKYMGYSEEWSQRIWDAHFIPPTLTDLLTAWRRGLITEDELDKYMILVDLDPRYKNIFDTRKYITPPVSMTRFMFETGAISAEDVRKNVQLEGYRPEDVDKITAFIVGFQARRWRTRYLQALSTGYTKGVVSEGELEKSVVDAGYTEETAHWIVETSKVRAKITAAAAVGKAEKLLSTAELKRLYLRGHIAEDLLRNELMVRGYSLGDVDLLVKMLEEEKVVEAAGGAKVALSVPELLNAWRYQEISEDGVRTELQLRGLSLDEVNILLNTKKKQWGMIGE